MEILDSIAGTIIEFIVAPIGRQAGYLLLYKDNFKKLRDQIDQIEKMKERIQHDVEAERLNGREIEVDVLSWQNRVNETIKEANQLCEDPRHANAGCSRWSCPNLISRHQLSRKAKKIIKNIVKVQENGMFDRVGYNPPLHIANFISTPKGCVELESRNSVKNDILSSLQDPKISKVGVYGLSGVGKTTLVKEVAKQVKDDKLFDVVVMVTISQSSNIERIQDEIAVQLGLHFEEITTIGRASRLHERIKEEKAILIILDDVWEKIVLEMLGIPSVDIREKNIFKNLVVPSKETYEGCKLLLTSRNQDILQKNETQKNFFLNILNDLESWSLFEDTVGDAVKDANFQNIAIQVAQRCAGLPVLIVTIAKSLKNKNIYYWKDTLNNLEKVDNINMQATIFSAVEFNYNRLEDDEVKGVFMLCGALGTFIWFSDLLKYACGLGVLKSIDTLEDARNRLYRIIDDLKASCLLLNDDESVEVIKMHDIFSDVASSIASRDQYVFTMKRNARWQDWPRKDFLEMCTQIILVRCCIQNLPERLDCPNLKLLHIDSTDNRTLEIPHTFFEGMGNLEVLDLTGMIISTLPISITSLTKLKALCLDQSYLKDVARIGALKNLEILSFVNSSLEEFPSEIGHLTHLRMLDLNNSGIEVIPSNILCKLTKIEELYMDNTSIKWAVDSSTEQDKNASLAEIGHLKRMTTLEIQIHEARILPRAIMFERLERYKIIIGDKWDWSSNKGTSRLLKLKLDTSIHLEHGIRTLIKKVEDLYLDEIRGISNVLFQLNSEGFQVLKHLHIQNNGEIQHFINTVERNQTLVLFPKLETLILHNLNNLVKICHGPLPINSFGKLAIIKVESCDQLEYLFSVLMVNALSQLLEIEVSKCNSMKMIVFVENGNSGTTVDDKIEFSSLRSLSLCYLPVVDDFYSNRLTSSMTTTENSLRINSPASFFNGMVSFSCLDTLKLSSINMEKIWDDDHLSVAYSIHNLANLTVEDCRGLKYLFSSSIIGSFQKLKQLEISKCDMMEEIIGMERRNGAALEEVQFSKLETIVINNMKSLKKVWHFQFDGLKNLEVNNCEKLENIFPAHMQRTFGRLETLKVSGCGSMEEIFRLNANEIQSEEDTTTQVTQLKKLHLLCLPKLKQIWRNEPQGALHLHNLQDVQVNQIGSRDPQSSLHFHNMQVVRVEECNDLEYLFPFSVAMDLLQLEEITIKNARRMKEIASDKEGHVESPVKFEFNHLTSLVLWNLDELEGFFAGNHSLTCPSLKELDVCNCTKLKLFNTQCTSSHARVSDNTLPVSIQQPLFILEEVIGTIEKLNLNNEDASTLFQSKISMDQFFKLEFLRLFDLEDALVTFPYWILQNLISLEWLVIQSNSFKVIFPDERPIDEKGHNETKTRLRKLTLHQLLELQYICKEGSKINPILEVLEYLVMDQCSSLKHLVPSSATFSHLTYLEVRNCNGLIDLITSSTATSLFKLTTLKIGDCKSLEHVVAKEREESKDEIAFSSLETLELEYLPKLNMFCSSNCSLKLPLLKKLVIMQCPRMKSFSARDPSTPMLRKIITNEQDEKWCWEGDLNRTASKLFQDMDAFTSFSHLELSEYPELKDLWYGLLGQKIFRNLKHLVVHKCTFLSNIIFSSNMVQLLYALEVLEVTDCDSIEAVFDVKVLDDKEMPSKKASGLKKLTLSNLPNLTHIWKEDPRETLGFENLQFVKATNCQNLKNLFSVSLCREFRQLEELHIESCGIEELVAMEEGLNELKFDFPLLKIFRLIHLTRLNDLYPRRYTLECPSLKILNVYRCEAVQIFAFDHLDSQQLRVGDGDINLPIQQALFDIEKVPVNLEQLSLNGKDAMRIFNGNYERNIFQCTKILRLQCFQETPVLFLNGLLEIFPSATTFQVRWSSFETLFPTEEIDHCSIRNPTQIKELWLYQLKELKHIWIDDSASHPLVHLARNLEYLSIWDCSMLTNVARPSTSFINLTTLEVRDCHGLVYLVTSFTAKSLLLLKSLTVENCGMLEEVVMIDEGESEEEIIFKSLEYLELACLSSFNSFSSGKHTFIFPSLVTFKVKGCNKMQNFSSGVTIAPFLRKVEVENGKKRWKEDLNTTIKQLFMDKAFQEQEKGNHEASSSNNTESSQTNQRTASTSRASSSEEHFEQSKADQIVGIGKQEIHKLPIPDTAMGNQEMQEIVERPLAQATEIARSPPTVYSEAIGTKEMYETIPKLLVEDVENICPASVPETALRNREIHQTFERPFIQAIQSTLSPITNQDTDIKTQEMYETIKNALIQAAQNVLSTTMVHITGSNCSEKSNDPKMLFDENFPSQSTNFVPAGNEATIDPSTSRALEVSTSSIQDAGIETKEMEETIQRPLVQTAEHASSPSFVEEIATGAQDTYETIDKTFAQAAQNALSPTIVQDKAIEIQEVHATNERLSVLPAQNVPSATMLYDIGKSYDLEMLARETADSVIAENRATCSQFSDAMTSSATRVADACSSFKEVMDISIEWMPYLEVGMKRHPQVLDWFNINQRRVFAFLFAEVTRILRTTRRGHLSEDDRNYIKQCCIALEAVGFEASWLTYVYECIEKCGDREYLKRRLEESEGKASNLKAEAREVESRASNLKAELEEVESKASNLKKESASVEASLVSLRDAASRLDDFIEF